MNLNDIIINKSLTELELVLELIGSDNHELLNQYFAMRKSFPNPERDQRAQDILDQISKRKNK